MALTKPKLSQNIDTDISVFTDPILVLHQGSTLANVDTGFLFNRANGLVSNVAFYWSETANSFVTAFTTSSGAPDANVAPTLFANVRVGIATANTIQSDSYRFSNGAAFVSTTIANTAEITANLTSGENVGLNLATTGVVAGNYGSATSIPTIVVDSKGRITSLTANAVSTTINLAGTSGTGSVAGGGTLTVNGASNQITTVVSSSTITIAFAQDITAPGNLTVTGNLVVQGNTTTLNTETLTIEDLNITVANGAINAAAADGAGLTVGGANARLLYKSVTDSWVFDKGVFASGNLVANSDTISSSVSTGALVVTGGAGISGALYIQNTGDVSANIGTLFTGNTVTNANLGAFQTFSNANAATQATSINIINANIGAFYNYANTKIGTNTNSNLVVEATTTSTSTTTGALVVRGGAGIAGNVYTNTLYTTNGLYWAGNGAAFSGDRAFSQVAVTGGNTIQANAEGISTLTIVGGSGISVIADAATDTLTFTTVATDSIWMSDHDSGLVTEAVVLSEDNGLVADGTTDEYDLGTITITGVVTGDTIAVNSIPGDRLITGTDISVGNITTTGDLIFTSTGERILGDFSNATISNRLMFQTSTTNGATNIYAIPNGTGTTASFSLSTSSDPNNSSIGQLAQTATDLRIQNVITGTGSYLPVSIYTGGSERVKIDATTGNVVITSTTASTTTTTGALVVRGGVGVAGKIVTTGLDSNAQLSIIYDGTADTGTSNNAAMLEIQDTGATSTPSIALHRPGLWATKIVLNTDNAVYFGGWSAAAGGQTIVTGNHNPGANVTYDLGSTTLRWRNIYTGDLNLSNGRGDYTIVEGEDDLFLYNNRTGKTYKFVVQEVDPSTVPPKLR
jgi:hypothetical protein